MLQILVEVVGKFMKKLQAQSKCQHQLHALDKVTLMVPQSSTLRPLFNNIVINNLSKTILT